MAREDHALSRRLLGVDVDPSDDHGVGTVQQDEERQADDVGAPIAELW